MRTRQACPHTVYVARREEQPTYYLKELERTSYIVIANRLSIEETKTLVHNI